MNVWTYWAGPKPEWIDVCLRSIERCCVKSTFHLLTPAKASSMTLGLDKRWLSLPPGVGTDCLRAALLAKYGGLWIDADTVCVRDPFDLFKRHNPEQFLYSTWTKQPRRAIAGYVYSPPRHPCALRWYDYVASALKHAKHIGWGDVGEKALTPILNMQHGVDNVWEMPLNTFLPVDIDCDVWRYFMLDPNGTEPTWQEMTAPNTIAFGLNYSWMKENCNDVLEPFPRWGKTLIQRLLIHAKQAL